MNSTTTAVRVQAGQLSVSDTVVNISVKPQASATYTARTWKTRRRASSLNHVVISAETLTSSVPLGEEPGDKRSVTTISNKRDCEWLVTDNQRSTEADLPIHSIVDQDSNAKMSGRKNPA
jgi:hypothetical protein